MGVGAVILVVVVAAIMAAAAQLLRVPGVRDARTRYDWAVVGLVALVTGFLVGVIRAIGPQWQGLYVGPAIIAEVFWTVVVSGLLRYVARPYPEPD